VAQIVVPSLVKFFTKVITSLAIWESKPEVGSSKNNNRGLETSANAIFTRLAYSCLISFDVYRFVMIHLASRNSSGQGTANLDVFATLQSKFSQYIVGGCYLAGQGFGYRPLMRILDSYVQQVSPSVQRYTSPSL